MFQFGFTTLVIAALIALSSTAKADGSSADLRYVVEDIHLAEIHPIERSPLRASRDGIVLAERTLAETRQYELRCRSVLFEAELQFESSRLGNNRRAIKSDRDYLQYARRELRMALALRHEAEFALNLSHAESELAEYQLLVLKGAPSASLYNRSRLEVQYSQALSNYAGAHDTAKYYQGQRRSVPWTDVASR